MLYDFRFPRPHLTEFCFRFLADPAEGPFNEWPGTPGQVGVWLFVNEQWYGPYLVGLPTVRGDFAQRETDLTTPERKALNRSILECKARLMELQQSAATPERLTGKLLIDEYGKRYLTAKPARSYNLVRTYLCPSMPKPVTNNEQL